MHCMLAFNICPLFLTRQIEIQFIKIFKLALTIYLLFIEAILRIDQSLAGGRERERMNE